MMTKEQVADILYWEIRRLGYDPEDEALQEILLLAFQEGSQYD